MVKKIWRKRLPEPFHIGGEIFQLLQAMGGSPGRSRLAILWQSWQEAIGPELAEIAQPLGSRGKILFIGAEDAIQMQELQFLSEDLLDRVNDFLGLPYFESVRFTIFGGKICLSEPQAYSEVTPCCKQAPAHLTGKYLAEMEKNSPVALCYARFLRR